jgi:glycosidase
MLAAVPGIGVAASVSISMGNQIIGEAIAQAATAPAANTETEFAADSDLNKMLYKYLTDTTHTIQKIYDAAITNVTPQTWMQMMGQSGAWSSISQNEDSDYIQGVLDFTQQYLTIKSIK